MLIHLYFTNLQSFKTTVEFEAGMGGDDSLVQMRAEAPRLGLLRKH